MRRRELSMGLLAVLLLGTPLVAAADPLTWQAASYSYRHFAAVVSGRDTPFYLYGDPFDLERRVFERIVTGVFQSSLRYIPTHFTTRPAPDSGRTFKVVILFNGPSTATMADLCAIRPRFYATPSHRNLDVMAVLCRGGSAISSVVASASGISGPEAADFTQLIGDVARALLPRVEPVLQGSTNKPPTPTLEGTR